jgi:DNA-binding transcriptional ArsR family regulator
MASKKPDPEKGRRSRKKFPPPLNCRHMQALSNEDRVKVFAVLCERVASPKQIAEQLGEGLSQVSYHVSVLRECGLIELDHTVPRRGALEHFYRAAGPTPGELGWTRLDLDAPALKELGSLSRDFLEAARGLQAKASERLAGANGGASDPAVATVFLATFQC